MTSTAKATRLSSVWARFGWQSALTVGLGGLAVSSLGWHAALVPAVFLAMVTGELCRADFAEHRLPNRLVLPGFAFALAGLALQWAATGQVPVVAMIAGAAYFTFLFGMNLAGGMGMGDVKLGGLLGLCLGLIDVSAACAGPLLAFVFGGVAGVVMLLGRRTSHTGPRVSIPFGPFMLAGFWVAVALAPIALAS